METLFQWIGVILGFIGYWFVIKKMRTGFIIWTISNVCLVIFSIITSYWGLMLLYLGYTGLSIYGLYDWREEPFETNWG